MRNHFKCDTNLVMVIGLEMRSNTSLFSSKS